MTCAEVKHTLLSLAEEKYQKFASSLLPGTDNLLGVRLPALRKLGKQIAKEDWREYIASGTDDSFEETMLAGIVIGCAPMRLSERFEYIAAYLPRISNWSVCDSFCLSLKSAKESPEQFWEFLLPYFSSQQEYELRFAVVMLLVYFIREEYWERALALLLSVRHEGYYVKMAVAWALSMFYVAFPQEVLPRLRQLPDDFTYNKTLQKIIESRASSKDTKELLRGMKRK